MGRKKTTYLGGEDYKMNEVLPKDFDMFFSKRLLYLVLAILFLMVVILV
ncbi:MAG: hypothetical protein GF368_05200 [Candidatus Aenigmarchaeota archaeon]|nr:hypothetical protein [Candidatus Aenigmarchaeota archaeon]